MCSTRKNWKVKAVMKDNAWIIKIKVPDNVSMDHIREFISLWFLLRKVKMLFIVSGSIELKGRLLEK